MGKNSARVHHDRDMATSVCANRILKPIGIETANYKGEKSGLLNGHMPSFRVLFTETEVPMRVPVQPSPQECLLCTSCRFRTHQSVVLLYRSDNFNMLATIQELNWFNWCSTVDYLQRRNVRNFQSAVHSGCFRWNGPQKRGIRWSTIVCFF